MNIPRIEGFDITTWVRENSTSVTWRARQKSLDRPVLLTIVKPGIEPERREAFVRNARLVARINLPGLAGVHDVAETPDGSPYAILEDFDGQSLRDLLSSAGGQLSQKRLLPIAHSIAETLYAAWNGHRFVHRNLKLDEIFLRTDGSVLIADFVSATTVGADGLLEDRSGEVVGTAVYMPPEQAEARPTLDTHADMYALGAVLYHLATGHAPFEEFAADPMHLLTILPFGTLPSPRDANTTITPAFEAALGRLLMKNPQDRYGSWGGFLQDLDSIAAGKPASIARAFVASGKPTLVPSVRYPAAAVPVATVADDEEGSATERVARRERIASGTPAFASVRWLVLGVATIAFAIWRWNHLNVTPQDIREQVEAKVEEVDSAIQKEVEGAASEATPSASEAALSASEAAPSASEAAPSPESPSSPESSLSTESPSFPEIPASSPATASLDLPATPEPPANPEPPKPSENVETSESSEFPVVPMATSPETDFLRSFIGAVRAESASGLFNVLRNWNAHHREEAVAAARTLQACGWPDDRLGNRMVQHGAPLTFTYKQQEVTVRPVSYVGGKLTGQFLQKDASAQPRSVTFPLSDLDPRTRWTLYRACAPVGSSTESENHAATALYALAAGDFAAFRAEIPLSSGLEPIFWRVSDTLEKAAKKTAP